MTIPETPPEGTEPISAVRPVTIPTRPRTIKPSIVLRIHGRTIRIRALRNQPKGIFRWLAILGPGLVAGAAGNDAGGIATYSQAGAQFGYQLLWVLLLVTISLMVVQEMSSRLGAATGRGLLGLIRSRFGIGWATLASVVVLVANFGLVMSEFVGISSAMRIFGVSPIISVAVSALIVSYLILAGNYNQVEKIFIVMAAIFLAYPVAAILAHPSLTGIIHGSFIPTIHNNPSFITLAIGLIGTTISPYQQVFQQSAVVEKGISRRRYGPERLDTYFGAIFSDVVSFFIIVATAATLHAAGNLHINTAAEAARALEPIVGNAAGALFAVGIIGASLMAASLIPLSTSFAFSEAFGLQAGIGMNIRRAPFFYGLFLGQVILGAALALIPNLPAFQLLVFIQVINGILFPILLLFILLLVNDPNIMGDLKNTRWSNIFGWGTFVTTSLAVGFLLVSQGLSLVGIHLMGG